MNKVNYFAQAYSRMRRQIHPHPVSVTAENVGEILDADFVLLSMDSGPDKKAIIVALTASGVRFIDTGLGVSNDPGGIAGQIRITTSTPGRSDHVERDGLISHLAGNDAGLCRSGRLLQNRGTGRVGSCCHHRGDLGGRLHGSRPLRPHDRRVPAHRPAYGAATRLAGRHPTDNAAFVDACEAAISIENQGWMARWVSDENG